VIYAKTFQISASSTPPFNLPYFNKLVRSPPDANSIITYSILPSESRNESLYSTMYGESRDAKILISLRAFSLSLKLYEEMFTFFIA